MAQYDEHYFEGKVVDNFYVRPMIRRSWAAQIRVLEEIDKICKRHNIKYFAEWGTLLGTVRHQGFVPWDDDLDIGMLRQDYRRFYYYAKKELPDDLSILNTYQRAEYDELLCRIVNSWSINLSPEFLEKNYGCPYAIGVDIFILDYIPRDPVAKELQLKLLMGAAWLAKIWYDENESAEEKQEMLEQLQEATGRVIDKDKPVKQQLYQLADQISGMYQEEESDAITILALMVNWPDYCLPKACYESTIEMPFETISIPVPVGYEQVLRLRYGEYYMVPVKHWATHSYPFFKAQEEMLEQKFREQGAEAPEMLDMMYHAPNEWYIGIQYHARLEQETLKASEFTRMELCLEDLAAYQESGAEWKPEGIRARAQLLVDVGARHICDVAKALGAKYIVIDTREFLDAAALDEALTAEIDYFRREKISCYLENSYVTAANGDIVRSMYSDAAWLNETLDAYNMLCGRDCFGLCMNVGHVNALGMNLRAFAEGTSLFLRLIHMNDNDGIHDDHQLPYTFINGGGMGNTDINRLIGTLVCMGYQGGVVFDVAGLWEKAPERMQGSLLELLWSLGAEWSGQYRLKEKLAETGAAYDGYQELQDVD